MGAFTGLMVGPITPTTLLNQRWLNATLLAYVVRPDPCNDQAEDGRRLRHPSRLVSMTVILLELNELNMAAIKAYTRKSLLPNFARIIEDHGVTETFSEEEHDYIEPWIQWVTAHTGRDFAEHEIFRLGDIRGRDLEQIWEMIERQGVTVGAVSPMNAENRCNDPAFFVPDPWTQGKISGSWIMRQMYGAIVQAVNDNAQSKLTAASALKLIMGLIAYGRVGSAAEYTRLFAGAFRKEAWAKALILDRLLADLFLHEVTRKKPGFASVFLNAGAHIQHHYMFSSSVYEGNLRNPDWYVSIGKDPVLESYLLYDNVIGDIKRMLPNSRLIVATGLHQVPHEELTFYWRIKDHKSFLEGLDIVFDRVEPRMSRDFVVVCKDEDTASDAERRLSMVTSTQQMPLFSIDNRGSDLFVSLVWPHDIGPDFEYSVGNDLRRGFRDQVAFVAIKNGEHDGTGYVIDTGDSRAGARFPLRQLPLRIAQACGVSLAA